MKAERLRGDLHLVAVETSTAICRVVEPEELSVGGGTVLAARWGHRRSTDIDFFCEPGAYAELDETKRAELEEALRAAPRVEAETPWCDPIATWCRVRDTEVTILPRPGVRRLAGRGDSYLDTTRVALQANAATAGEPLPVPHPVRDRRGRARVAVGAAAESARPGSES